MGKSKYPMLGTVFASRFVAILVAISTITPPMVVPMVVPMTAFADTPTAGDTARKLPTVEEACSAIRAAADGKLTAMDGSALSFTKQECMSLPRRSRNAATCQTTVSEANNAGETADTLCARDHATLNASAASYCALRDINKSNPSTIYCEAYDSSKRAKSGSTITLALDAAAAGACWAEYYSLKGKLKLYLETKNSMPDLPKRGVCAGASIAAGLGELLQTATTLHATGKIKIDSDNVATEKHGNATQVIQVAMSAGLSAAAIRLGVCQYQPDAPTCAKRAMQYDKAKVVAGGKSTQASAANMKINPEIVKDKAALAEAKERLARAEAKEKAAGTSVTEAETLVKKTECIATGTSCSLAQAAAHEAALNSLAQKKIALIDAQTALTNAGVDRQNASNVVKTNEDAIATLEGEYAENKKTIETSDKDWTTAQMQSRLDLAYSSALIFTALAAMRGVTLLAADSTQRKAKDILQSMFDSNNGAAAFGGGGYTGSGTNVYTSGASSFAPSATTQPTQSLAVAAGSPESFLLPPGAPHTEAMKNIARQIPAAKAEQAAAGGAAGVGGLISSVASGMGGADPREINRVVTTAFANLPKDGGDYSSGSGGSKLASKGGDGSGDLNLKSLFGGGEKEEHAAAAPDLAYRGPASDDIWHSQNPRGNNLFQIVSEKYDTVQRKSDLAP